MTPPIAPARVVSKFEHDLLVISRYIFGASNSQQALQIITTRHDEPKCLSRNCIELVQDTLAKGLVLNLTRTGGWRDETFIEDRMPTRGRVWDRIPLEQRRLHFSRNALDFLIWLTAHRPDRSNDRWQSITQSTAADELFFALAYARLRKLPDVVGALRIRSAFHHNPFCWLRWPSDFFAESQMQPPDFTAVFFGLRAAALECLQVELTRLWIASERRKATISDWNEMRRVGQAETMLLNAFLSSAESAQRPDLARFILHTLHGVLKARDPQATDWIGNLSTNAPAKLSERLYIQRSAFAVIRHAETFARWDREARLVGYFDDGYAWTQFWKSQYESVDGPELHSKSQRILNQIEPLRS